MFIRNKFDRVNHKKIERMYSEEGLQLPRKGKKRRYMFYIKTLKRLSARPYERWSLDFMTDSTSSSRKFWDECLNLHWFESINEARKIIEKGRDEYNTIRPHSSLGHVVPVEFRNRYENRNTDDKISRKLSFSVDQN